MTIRTEMEKYAEATDAAVKAIDKALEEIRELNSMQPHDRLIGKLVEQGIKEHRAAEFASHSGNCLSMMSEALLDAQTEARHLSGRLETCLRDLKAAMGRLV